MAVCVRCTQCGNDYRLDTPVCHKCWNNLRKYRKFKVVVRTADGSWRTKVVPSLLKARDIERSWRQKVRVERAAAGRSSVTLNMLWEHYIKWAQRHKKTWKDDLCRWRKHIAPAIGHLAMGQVTQTDIERMVQRMQSTTLANGRPYRPATILHVVGLVRRMYNWAIQTARFTGRRPSFHYPIVDRRQPSLYILSREEVTHLLEAMNRWRHERAALLVKFLLFSGRRKGEGLALRWQDVERRYRRIRFQRRLRGRTFTQTVPINTHCHAIIQRCWQMRRGDFVFPSRTGKYFHSFDKVWYNLRCKEGFEFLLRDLRSTFAFYVLGTGSVDLTALGALMGHTSPTTTQRYAHLAPPTTLSSAGPLDAAFVQFHL